MFCTLNHLHIADRMDYGEWTENSRGTYNKWDGVSRSTTQVTGYVSLCKVLLMFQVNFVCPNGPTVKYFLKIWFMQI